MQGLHKNFTRAALAVLSAAALAPGAHAGTPAKADAALARRMTAPGTRGSVGVIAQTTGPLTGAQQAQLAALGLDVSRRLPLIHAVAGRVPTRNLPRLAALPFLTRLSYDGVVRKSDAFTVGHSGADVAFAGQGLTGLGVGIAVVDSGVSPTSLDLADTGHGAGPFGLAYRVTDAVSFVTGDASPADACGHGTHVAGLAAGNGWASSGPTCTQTFYGIARRASLINVRVLNGQGSGNISDVIAGVQWVIANKSKDHIRVMNLSLGHPICESYTTDPLCQAVEKAWKAGIVVVCAAGNTGRLNSANTAGADNEGWGTSYGSIQSPANDPYVITVGAMKNTDGAKADDRIATYSSRGPSVLDLVIKPDIVAPGNLVISLDASQSSLDTVDGGTNRIPLSTYDWMGTVTGALPIWLTLSGAVNLSVATNASLSYFRLSGTSMASPVVAGAAALLLQQTPGLSPDTVKARLMASADKWVNAQGVGDPCTYGAGYLDVPAALASTVTVPAGTYALSPTVSQDGSGNLYADLPAPIWGTSVTDQRAIWGARAVWGSSDGQLSDSRAVWGSRATWGSSAGADRATWGSSGTADLSSIALNGE